MLKDQQTDCVEKSYTVYWVNHSMSCETWTTPKCGCISVDLSVCNFAHPSQENVYVYSCCYFFCVYVCVSTVSAGAGHIEGEDKEGRRSRGDRYLAAHEPSNAA